jgi:hypothetical protein
MAIDIVQFVDIIYSKKENTKIKHRIDDIVLNVINIQLLIKNKKRRKNIFYGYSNILNILPIQRKCQNMDIIDQPFEEILKCLKIKTFLFMKRKKDI